jgi:sulfotransferase|tara:strand:- start:32 stop:868 length:837 start_codon:yes stop_codon:yes gene_type:complete
MKHEYYFMAGLPRSGVTLLKTLLDQNPKIHSGPISPVVELLYYNNKYFIDSESYDAFPKPKAAHRIVSSIIDNYYYDIEKPIIIDHNRAWPGNIERIKTYINPNPKIICTVRNVLDILTSFITLVHKNNDQVSYLDEFLIEKGYPCTDELRCQHLMSMEGIVGQSLYVLYKSLFICHDDSHLLLVEYEDIVNNPDVTMKRIYDFLELDYYQHNYTYIDNKHPENDKEWNLKDMHKVRKELKKISKDPKDILNEAVLYNFSDFEFWKNNNHKYIFQEIA